MARGRSKRTTKERISTVSIEQVQDLITQYAKAKAKLKGIEAEIELKVTEVKDGYALATAELASKMKDVSQQLQLYAELNEHEFEKTRSKKFPNGRIGFRMGTPSVRCLRGLKMDGVLELTKVHAPDYLRTKVELDKQSIIKDVEKLEEAGLLKKIGVKVSQTERFFIEAEEVVLTDE